MMSFLCRLPDVENFEPGEGGESPLAKIDSFVQLHLPEVRRTGKARDRYHASVGGLVVVLYPLCRPAQR